MKKFKKFIWSFLLIMVVIMVPALAWGQSQIEKSYDNYMEPIMKGLQGDRITVDDDEIINDNFFRYGKTVKIEGDIMGDAIVMASETLTIDGDVAGDVLAAAETVIINGDVQGNIRIAAAEVTVNGQIGKNATLFAGTANFNEEASIGWSLAFVAGKVNINSPVSGNIYGFGGEVNINTTVGSNVTLFLDEYGELDIMADTVIDGKLEYRGDKTATIDDAAVIMGDTIHKLLPESVTQARDYMTRFWIYGKFISLFSLLLIGTLIVSIFVKTSDNLMKKMADNPAGKMLWGLLFLVAVPLGLIILAITVIGAPLALIGLGFYLLLNYISSIFIGLFIGDKILNYKKDKLINPVWSMMLGVLIYVIVKNIPIIGWLVGFIGTVWFLGTIILYINEYYKNNKKGKKENVKNQS